MISAVRSSKTFRLAPWTGYVSRSLLQDLLPKVAQPEIVSFGLGLPAPELFPSAEFSAACADVLRNNPKSLQYGPPCGALKSHVVSLMADRGVECNEEQVFLTHGAQQGVHFLAELLLERNRQIIMEEFCYPGFQQIVSFFQPEILSVDSDLHTGMDVDKVEWYLSHGSRPAFIYTIANGHNPLGISLSAEKRERLAWLSSFYGVPLLEEDPYGYLTYSTNPLCPLAAQAKETALYVGSFSKVLAPSVRVGWLVVPKELTPYLAILKESSDIDMAPFSQYVVARMLETCFFTDHLRRLRSEYMRRRDVMLDALQTQFPAGTRWAVPDAGLYIWVQLPQHFDTMRTLDSALSECGVAYMPGQAFTTRVSRSARSSMRLNFSYPTVEQIVTGLHSLGDLFRSLPTNLQMSCAG
jgi:2-aminoadipate transaminase